MFFYKILFRSRFWFLMPWFPFRASETVEKKEKDEEDKEV